MDKIRLAFSAIAAAIRGKTGTTTKMTPGEMPAAINSISGGCDINNADYLFFSGARLDEMDTIMPMTKNCTSIAHGFDSAKQLTTAPKLNLQNCKSAECLYYKCTALTSVGDINMPDCTDVTALLSGCTSLTTLPNLNIPKGSGPAMFQSTAITEAKDINLPAQTLSMDMFTQCNNLQIVSGLKIPLCSNTIHTCSSDPVLTDAEISQLKGVGPYTFFVCDRLKNITLGSPGHPVESISTTATRSCPALETITIYTADGLDPTDGSKLGAPDTCTINWLKA